MALGAVWCDCTGKQALPLHIKPFASGRNCCLWVDEVALKATVSVQLFPAAGMMLVTSCSHRVMVHTAAVGNLCPNVTGSSRSEAAELI